MISDVSNVNVVTNAPLGYKLYISSSNANLTSTNTSITQSFTPVTSTTLTPNTWGFSTDTGSSKSWQAVPQVTNPGDKTEDEIISAGATKISELATPNYPTGTDIPVYYGINATTNMPTGTYSTTVTYTAFGEGIPPEHTMQNFTLEECTAMTTDSQITLPDTRNNREYTIVKARDGNCWMADNLWLYNIDNPSQSLTISSLDSDFGSSTTETTFTIPATSNWSTNITSESKLHVATNSGYTGEPYYNWFLATAGSTASSGTVSTSICPRGWRLPINGDQYQNKSYAKLLSSYSITTGAQLLNQTSLGFTKYYGYWSYPLNREESQGESNYLWSATSSDSTNNRAYQILYTSSSVSVQNSNPKGFGFSVRCVLNGTEDEQMQNFTLTDCANMSTDETKKLYDRRNGQQYGIIKARDGNCWMTDNLNIVNMTVSAADSDFTSGTFIIPATSNWSNNEYSAAKVHTASGVGSYATTDTSYYGEQYYNWCATTAQTSCGGTSVATTSICPKNWKIPIGGSASINYTYARLLNAYGYTKSSQFVNSSNVLGFSKYYGDWDWGYPSEYAQGYYSCFWSSTPNSTDSAYRTYYDSKNNVTTQMEGRKGYGYSLRCLLRN